MRWSDALVPLNLVVFDGIFCIGWAGFLGASRQPEQYQGE